MAVFHFTDRLRRLNHRCSDRSHPDHSILRPHVRHTWETMEGYLHQQPGEASHHRCDGAGGGRAGGAAAGRHSLARLLCQGKSV